MSQNRISCSIFLRLSIHSHRNCSTRHRKVRWYIRNGVVAVCQCVLGNRIRTNSFTRYATQRTGQGIATHQRTSSNGERQGWICCTKFLRQRISSYRYWTLGNSEQRTCIGDVVVGVVQRATQNR